MKIFELNPHNKGNISILMNKLDKNIYYPLGEDQFQISHGKNYFSFFERMGEIQSVLYGEEKDIEGIFTIVKRKINGTYINYMCDLKKKNDSKRNVMISMAKYFFNNLYKSNEKYYAIHMNKKGQKDNMIVKLLSSYINKYSKEVKEEFVTNTDILNLYTLSYSELLKYRKDIEKLKGGYISINNLMGIKDIILKSTNKPMELLHLEFKKEKQPISEDYKSYTFMFCTLLNSDLDKLLHINNIPLNSTATISNFGMKDFDFEFINTGEI
jgi:hypothetical protein